MIRLSIGLITSHEEVAPKVIDVSPTEKMEVLLIDHLGYFAPDLVMLCGDTEVWSADSQDSIDLSQFEGLELMVYEKQCTKYKVLKELRKAYKNATDKMAQFFVKTPMIHVEMKIHGQPLIGLVDTGSQISIITKELAEHCGILHKLDVRFQVDASGVGGVRKSIGKILDTDFEFPNQQFMPVVLTVFDEKPFGDSDLIIGVDVLTAYNANIDFKNQKIVFNEEVVVNMVKKEEAN